MPTIRCPLLYAHSYMPTLICPLLDAHYFMPTLICPLRTGHEGGQRREHVRRAVAQRQQRDAGGGLGQVPVAGQPPDDGAEVLRGARAGSDRIRSDQIVSDLIRSGRIKLGQAGSGDGAVVLRGARTGRIRSYRIVPDRVGWNVPDRTGRTGSG